MGLQHRPAHLPAKADVGVSQQILAQGGIMPPTISTFSGAFVVTANGQRYTVQQRRLPLIVAGSNAHLCKIYWGEEGWEPAKADPPLCFSDNGVAPSSTALEPQCATCAACPHNVRGSETSKASGKPIKACRDLYKLGVFVAGDPEHRLYLFPITPGSFKTFRQYVAQLAEMGADLSEVITIVSFSDTTPNTYVFEAKDWINEAQHALIQQANESEDVKRVTGGFDVPFAERSLPPPTKQEYDAEIARLQQKHAIKEVSPLTSSMLQRSEEATRPPEPAQARTRGRPPGSKNKPKETVVGPGPEAVSAAFASAAPSSPLAAAAAEDDEGFQPVGFLRNDTRPPAADEPDSRMQEELAKAFKFKL